MQKENILQEEKAEIIQIITDIEGECELKNLLTYCRILANMENDTAVPSEYEKALCVDLLLRECDGRRKLNDKDLKKLWYFLSTYVKQKEVRV